MNEHLMVSFAALLALAPPALAGLALGAFFFGGLYWTLRRGLVSTRPALWFLASLAVRLSLTLGGFYLVAGDRWSAWLACLVGFLIARRLLTRWLPRLLPSRSLTAMPTKEASHAPEP